MQGVHGRPGRERAAFTLIEVLLAIGLVSVMLGSALVAASSSYRAYRNTRLSVTLSDQARRAVARVTTALLTSGPDLMFPDPSGDRGTDALTIQEVVGTDGEEPVLGPQLRFAFRYDPGETDDGVDDDGDGLVDEGQLVMTRNVGTADEVQVVLCDGVCELAPGELQNLADDNGNGLVDERGFNVQGADGVLTVRISLEAIDSDGRLVQRTVETTIRTRN